MPENYEVMYTHPGGATATFIRHDGELDALAKGLDAEQFWVFKNVKALLVRNEEDDLAEASRQMRQIGFVAAVRELRAPVPAAVAAPAYALAGVEEHAGPHLPGPSYWPLLLAASATLAFLGFLSWENLLPTPVALIIVALGLICVLISMIGWGLEPI
ncbi:MAG: hypothetical protein ACRDHP_02520 [Ktedonobacterales bacterium]